MLPRSCHCIIPKLNLPVDVMNLNHFSSKNENLNQLLAQSAHWHKLDKALKQLMPANLAQYIQVACIRDGCLMIVACSSMAAGRLRMLLPTLLPALQQVEAGIVATQVKIDLLPAPKKITKKAVLSQTARAALADSANAVSHHPELAQALRRLSMKKD